jgi:hypothetical protein
MLKKIITLSIITAVVLIGVENVIARERTDVPEQRPRRRQGQEGRPGQRGRAQQFRGRQSNNEAPAKGAETDKKIEAMRKKRQQALEQKGTPRDRVGRRSQRSRPGRNQLMQQMFGGRARGLRGRGIGGWSRRYQCEVLCPWRQRSMGGRGRGFQGRGMMGRGGWSFQGRGMMGRGGQDFLGRGMMGRGGQGFLGRGMMGRGGQGFRGRGMDGWGQGFRGRGMMGGQGPGMSAVPDVRPYPPKPPQEDILRPAQPMQRRGMGRRGGGGPFSGRGGPGPGPDNN